MGRSANSFAFLLVFVLLALVIYFIYQAATGTSGTTSVDQASVPPESKERKADPDLFASPRPVPPAEPSKKEEVPAPPGGEMGIPPKEPVIPEPPKDPIEIPEPAPDPRMSLPVIPIIDPPPAPEPGPPAVPAPSVSKQDQLLPMDNEYRTQAGDTPWVLAVVLLGDGKRWPDIVAANPALLQDGRSPDKDTALPAGLSIKAPKDVAPKEETPVPPGESTEYEVQAGDTLNAIMHRFYGEASMTIQREILAANPNLDPDLLHVKAKIKLPAIPGKGPKKNP